MESDRYLRVLIHMYPADERILPNGTGYITDVGMTGPINSVLGVRRELVVNKFITQLPVRFKSSVRRCDI